MGWNTESSLFQKVCRKKSSESGYENPDIFEQTLLNPKPITWDFLHDSAKHFDSFPFDNSFEGLSRLGFA